MNTTRKKGRPKKNEDEKRVKVFFYIPGALKAALEREQIETGAPTLSATIAQIITKHFRSF